ncbi:hypothetical protein [Kitasatospora sp. NPDC051914]|uniref:hypothetical protein n=1 Tax=Kitasatospora sp. NPDC051914 TaxID=3154945 RepID=UPI00342D65FD
MDERSAVFSRDEAAAAYLARVVESLAAAGLRPATWGLSDMPVAAPDARGPLRSAVLRWAPEHPLVNADLFPYGALALWDTATGWRVVGPDADGSLVRPNTPPRAAFPSPWLPGSAPPEPVDVVRGLSLVLLGLRRNLTLAALEAARARVWTTAGRAASPPLPGPALPDIPGRRGQRAGRSVAGLCRRSRNSALATIM